MFEIPGKYTSATVMVDSVDQETMKQITAMVNHPAFTGPVRIMPDCHAGKGSVIGFTMPAGDKIVPNVIGVDIGCGMLMSELQGLTKDVVDLAQLDKAIRAVVPMGAGGYKKDYFYKLEELIVVMRKHLLADLSAYRAIGGTRFNVPFNKALSILESRKNFEADFLTRINCTEGRLLESIGTLGGGNHFIEIGELAGQLYITVHTGSRQIGLKVANAFQYTAKKALENGDEKWTFNLNDSAYLVGEDADDYLACMMLAQIYARVNRAVIMSEIHEALAFLGVRNTTYKSWSECVHNFISPQDGIIRKGSISAASGEFLIVPLTPKDGIIIGHGRGNTDWNCSAPHGAGRVMSRAEAKRSITDEQADAAMDGVYASCKPKDESPLAYKDPQLILDSIGDTMDIIGIVRPILNLKAMDTDE